MDELIREGISNSLDENYRYLKELFKDSSDIVFREFYVEDYKAALIYIDGMVDKILLDNFVLRPLMQGWKSVSKREEIKDRLLTVSEIRETKTFKDGITMMMSGDTLMLVDGLTEGYVIGTRFWPARGISEPQGETVIRGSREGFSETLRFNTALIRRRIRDTRLKMEHKFIGRRSKTDVIIAYIDDIVNKEVLEELKNRIDKVDIDALLDSSYLEQLIEDNYISIFPQIQSTERPDVVAASLYEGRVAIIVDNSPFVIVVPATLPTLFQSPDDYYGRWINSTVVRLIRFFSIMLSLVLAPLYVAVTSFHTSIIPTKLAYSIAASREGVPFPAYLEAIIMEISLALLMEAVVRLPKPIGSTIGIVGGLIIGQAAVSAGVVSPIMIIIVSITAITSFISPNYEVTSAFRLVRFLLIIASAVIGLYGILLGVIVLIIHLVKLKSFNIPYLSPAVNTETSDLKDFILRLPIRFFKERPKFIKPGDKIRQK